LNVVIVDSSFGHGGSSESNRIVWFLLFSNNNCPCHDAFQNATAIPLPGDIAGCFKELNNSKSVFVWFLSHSDRRNIVDYGLGRFDIKDDPGLALREWKPIGESC
jgi:hypothetical protein